MQKITVITVGRLRESYLREAAEEYLKRLMGYCSANVIEIDPAPLTERASPAEINKALEAEGIAIIKRLPPQRLDIALCIEGRRMGSPAFSQLIAEAAQKYEGINFIIGGSYGLSDEVKARAAVRLSMSDMTFPHRLARIMLFEQIYRAYKIAEGARYHK